MPVRFSKDSRRQCAFPGSALYLEEAEDRPVTMERHSSTRTEDEMIAAILSGDTQLYHELIGPHERSVYLMALFFMKNEADAEDVAQQAFIKAFRSLASFCAESKFGAWLIGITLNEVSSLLRRQSRVCRESPDELNDELPDGGKNISPALLCDRCGIPSETIEPEEVRRLLLQAVEAPPDVCR